MARGITGDALTTLATVCTGRTINTGSGAEGYFPDGYWFSLSFCDSPL